MKLKGFYTKLGGELAAKFTLGQGLAITRVVAGSGSTAADDPALALPCQTLAVNTAFREGTVVTVPVTLAEVLAEKDYTLTELGIYANDPDKGEILYRICRMDTPLPIRAGGLLCLRVYIKASVSGDPEVEVLCSPDGLMTEREFGPVRDVVQSLAVPSRSVTLAAAELTAYLDALPRLLTENITITVTGTLNGNLTVQGFYGSGKLTLRAAALGDFVMAGRMDIVDCDIDVTLQNLSFVPAASLTLRTLGTSGNGCVSVSGCSFTNPNGAAGLIAMQAMTHGRIVVRDSSVSGYAYAAGTYFGGEVAISGSDAGAYSNNGAGVSLYHGGLVQLCGSTPNTLGGGYNQKNGGGLIVSSACQVI